jgi:DNA polymerase III sliding clamp (beta) subunit (PCNA family)
MSGQIDAEQSGNKLTLKSAKAVVELEIQPIQLVKLPEDAKNSVVFEVAGFKKALAVAFASASPAKSAAFGGAVQLQSQPLDIHNDGPLPQSYRIVGTDSIVLTVATVLQQVPKPFKTLINLTAASIVQIMDGPEVTMGDTEKYLVIKSGDTTVYAAKPVQKYPDFDKLLAMLPTIKFKLNPQEWLSALKTVEALLDEEQDKGAIALHLVDGVVQFRNIGVGHVASDEASYEQLEPDSVFDPKDLTLKLNAKYLSGFLNRAGAEATLGITEHPVRLESEGVVVLAMPIGAKK